MLTDPLAVRICIYLRTLATPELKGRYIQHPMILPGGFAVYDGQ